MKIPKEIWNKWSEDLVKYYEHTDPFDKDGLLTDTMRIADFPLRIFRVLYSCAYLGENDFFAGGTLTKDILKVTGWRMPDKATVEQIERDETMSKRLEQKCGKYINKKQFTKLIKEQRLVLPVEWRMFYILYVPSTIFTTEELIFMKNNPCWLLPLDDDLKKMDKEQQK